VDVEHARVTTFETDTNETVSSGCGGFISPIVLFSRPVFNRFGVVSVNVWEQSSFLRLGSFSLNLASLQDYDYVEGKEKIRISNDTVVFLVATFVPSILGKEWSSLMKIGKVGENLPFHLSFVFSTC